MSGQTTTATGRQVDVRRLSGFDDPLVAGHAWDRLLASSATDVIFLTREWLRTWWHTVGAGDLLLLAAVEDGRCVALAPLYTRAGEVLFLASGDGDQLDFMGDVARPGVLAGLLRAARMSVPGCVGLRLFAIPDRSPTIAHITDAASAAGLTAHHTDTWVTPLVQLDRLRDAGTGVDSASIRKRERWFERLAPLVFRQETEPDRIAPHIAAYIAQTNDRWNAAGLDGPFAARARRAFFEHLLAGAAPRGSVCFSWLEWNGRPIAFECGWRHRRTYVGGPACFAVDLTRQSPGQILQYRLLRAALDGGLDRYDYGVGDDPYKMKVATDAPTVLTWRLFPVADDATASAPTEAPR
jgi:CelD/BcsL family acetyltransferase involved in cellulose biosynthesis